tara:strand:+ start:324 stop:632 length:309 start_codon:yes stop_codon:yes gene_type:complete
MNKKQKAWNDEDIIRRLILQEKAALELSRKKEEWKKKSPYEKRKINKALKEKREKDAKEEAKKREKREKIYNQEKSNENFRFWMWIFLIVLFYFIIFSGGGK